MATKYYSVLRDIDTFASSDIIIMNICFLAT